MFFLLGIRDNMKSKTTSKVKKAKEIIVSPAQEHIKIGKEFSECPLTKDKLLGKIVKKGEYIVFEDSYFLTQEEEEKLNDAESLGSIFNIPIINKKLEKIKKEIKKGKEEEGKPKFKIIKVNPNCSVIITKDTKFTFENAKKKKQRN